MATLETENRLQLRYLLFIAYSRLIFKHKNDPHFKAYT